MPQFQILPGKQMELTKTGLCCKPDSMKDTRQITPSSPDAKALAELQAQIRRNATRTNIDGGFELGWGVAILLGGLDVYIATAWPKWIFASLWSSWVTCLPLLAMCFAPYAIPRAINRWITWPRIGYAVNPNELKLGHLIKMLFFGLALGESMAILIMLGLTLQAGWRPALAHEGWRHLLWQATKLLLSVATAIYLGRKVITKRQPMPSAYDASVFNKSLAQTAGGRRLLRNVKLGMLLLVIGLPVAVTGMVWCVIRVADLTTVHDDRGWRELTMSTVIVASNGLLYLMINGASIRRYKWKWLLLPVLLIAPLFASAIIPEPAVNFDLTNVRSLTPVMIAIGLVWFLSGTVTLGVFMRQNPLPEEPAA